MDIGETIRRLRVQHGLTQEELGLRTDLTKGFISQLERNLTSPSIATLMDILECLGTDLQHFFAEEPPSKLVFSEEDTFTTETPEYTIRWLVPNAQKNRMEPILVTLAPGGATALDDPHDGEEWGYVLAGQVTVQLGNQVHRARKGESFSFIPSAPHRIQNVGRSEARILWVSTPPTF